MWRMALVGVVVAAAYFGLSAWHHRTTSLETFGEPWTLGELVDALEDQGMEVQVTGSLTFYDEISFENLGGLPPIPGPVARTRAQLGEAEANLYIYPDPSARNEAWPSHADSPYVAAQYFVYVTDQLAIAIDNVVVHWNPLGGWPGPPQLEDVVADLEGG